ncbi:Aste57867_2868 [Aphanomyces stellatus]|uniref:Aste57867_2868 protein n=1 Tax=Aphanomyces stellatus TaxID=120398 RepID=A0A485KC93_9STRA|nr:hypothetical protein As57867_002860 [Aphanomyces stellatus]VFT80054.1 Aste57867_2868 [Aphanomyces stellatus]
MPSTHTNDPQSTTTVDHFRSTDIIIMEESDAKDTNAYIDRFQSRHRMRVVGIATAVLLVVGVAVAVVVATESGDAPAVSQGSALRAKPTTTVPTTTTVAPLDTWTPVADINSTLVNPEPTTGTPTTTTVAPTTIVPVTATTAAPTTTSAPPATTTTTTASPAPTTTARTTNPPTNAPTTPPTTVAPKPPASTTPMPLTPTTTPSSGGVAQTISWNWFMSNTLDCDGSLSMDTLNRGLYVGSENVPADCGKTATFSYKDKTVTATIVWRTTGGKSYHELSPQAFANLLGANVNMATIPNAAAMQAAINDPGHVTAMCTAGAC